MASSAKCYTLRKKEGTFDDIEKQIKKAQFHKGSFFYGEKYITYRTDFNEVYVAPKGNTGLGKSEFHRTDAPGSMSVSFLGQIVPNARGSAMSALGNYKVNEEDPQQIKDDKTVRHMFMLECPTNASTMIQKAFANQVAVLNNIFATDARNSNSPDAAHLYWSPFTAQELGGSDCIKVFMQPTYKVPRNYGNPSPLKVTTTKPKMFDLDADDEGPGSSIAQSTSTLSESGLSEITLPEEPGQSHVQLGALYDPSLLADYGGWIFAHENARLAQHAIYDTAEKLIPPWQIYSKLRPGTLVLVQATMMVWHTKGNYDRRIYQVIADKIKVIDESDEPLEHRTIPSYFPRDPETPSRKKNRADDDDNAFDVFETPSRKRVRRTADKEIAGQSMVVDKARK